VRCLASPRPIWNFDGSSTGQAPGEDSEVLIKPQAIYPDPFRGGDNILVMCDCYKPDMTPIKGNTRIGAAEIFDQVMMMMMMTGRVGVSPTFLQRGPFACLALSVVQLAHRAVPCRTFDPAFGSHGMLTWRSAFCVAWRGRANR
jgi:hypothetical protein